MTLSKKDKEALISIEKCERATARYKILEKLQKEKNAIEAPYIEKAEELKKQRIAALNEAGLLNLDAGCGMKHPELERFDAETNKIIKQILRE